jgi:hypothetical protein
MRPETGYRNDGYKQVLVTVETHKRLFQRKGLLTTHRGENVSINDAIAEALNASEPIVIAEIAQAQA